MTARRRAALLAGAALLALAAAPSTAAPARPAQDPGTATAAAAGPTMTVRSQTPWVQPDGTFRVDLEIDGAPPGADLVATIHQATDSRSAFDPTVTAAEPGPALDTLVIAPSSRSSDRIDLDDAFPLGDGRKVVSVSIPIQPKACQCARYGLTRAGVYPINLRVRSADGGTIAHLVTHLIRLPGAGEAPDASARLRVATLLDLHAPPATQPDGSVRVDDADARRLDAVAKAAVDHPEVALTLDPTPEVLEALARSGEAGDAEDAALLTRIRDAAAGDDRQVLAGTYVDLDAAAWVRAGLDDDLRHQRDRGTDAITKILGRPDNSTWVAAPDTDGDTVRELLGGGVDQLIVPETNLSPVDPATFPADLTQSFAVSTEGNRPIPAVQVDDRLQQAVGRDADPVLAAHQVLAQLAVISFSQRGAPGGVVLSPPDGRQPDGKELDVLLDALSRDNPLLTTATIDQLFAEVPRAGSNGAASLGLSDRGGDLTRALVPRAPSDLGRYPSQLRGAQRRLNAYASMLPANSPRPGRLATPVDISGATDLDADERAAYLDAVDRALQKVFDAIQAPATETVTLGTREADIPLSLRSDLRYPVRVVVQLETSTRMTFPGGPSQTVVIKPDASNRIKVRVRVKVSGVSPLRVRVVSPDGAVELGNSRYSVRSTAISGVGLILTVGAALFLLLWWGRHWRDSRRHGRHAAGTHPGHPMAET